MPPAPVKLTPDELKRKILFVPCESKEQLHKWILVFLDLDLPDSKVDPESDCTPMEMVWDCYSHMLRNDDPLFKRVLYFSSREGGKTLAEAVIEVMCLVHLQRDVVHLAAIEAQSRKAQEYVRGFMSRPLLRDFLVSDNQREIMVRRYYDKNTDETLSPTQFEELSKVDSGRFEMIQNYARIIVATLQSTNGQHSSVMCLDGDSQILSKIRSPKKNRKREARTARGIFRILSGKNPGGRTGGEIATVVSSPMEDVELLTLNHSDGGWEWAKIVRAQSSFQKAVEIETATGKKLVCSLDHRSFVVGRGYVEASEMAVGDKLVWVGKAHSEVIRVIEPANDNYEPWVPANDNYDLWDQIVLGSLLGDAGIYRRATSNPHLYERHCLKQRAYMEWKRSIIAQKLRTSDQKGAVSGYTGEEQFGFYTNNSPELLPYVKFKTTLEGIERLGPVGLAVWYMDDGCKGGGVRFSTECFTEEQNQFLAEFLGRKFGVNCKVHNYLRDGRKLYYLSGGVKAKRRLEEICREHLHVDMAYKLSLDRHKSNCRHCGKEFFFIDRGNTAVDCGDAVCMLLTKHVIRVDEIVAIRDVGERWLYDFTVEKNHNLIANGLLTHNCLDEIDIIKDKKSYEEAQLIPTEGKGGKQSLTILTSTRKVSFGLVQIEIDKKEETGLIVKHWNILDVTEACPASRHLPELPKLPLYVSKDLLRHATVEGYRELPEESKAKYDELDKEAFAGCATCKLYPMCRGNLATKQKSKKSPISFIKSIDHTIGQFRIVSLNTAKAQLLCWKPSTDGLIYPQFDPDIHMLTAAQMAQKVTGEVHDPNMTKSELISLMKSFDVKWQAGMDFGYTHDFAVTAGFTDGFRAFVIDVISQSELDDEQKLVVCNKQIKHLKPTIWPDTAYPGTIATFKRKGYRMVDNWNKGPESVNAGIEVVRMMLRPSVGEPRLYILKGDEMCELLARRLKQYHWKMEPDGRIGKDPDKELDDLCDSTRYWLMNVFAAAKGSVRVGKDTPIKSAEQIEEDRSRSFLREAMKEHGIADEGEVDTVSISQGSFRFKM